MDPKNTPASRAAAAESDAIAMDRIRIIESENMGPVTEESVARSTVPPRPVVVARPVAPTPIVNTPSVVPERTPFQPTPLVPSEPIIQVQPVVIAPQAPKAAPAIIQPAPTPVVVVKEPVPELPAKKLTIAERIIEETKKPGPTSKFRPFTRSSTKRTNIIAVIVIAAVILGGTFIAWQVIAR